MGNSKHDFDKEILELDSLRGYVLDFLDVKDLHKVAGTSKGFALHISEPWALCERLERFLGIKLKDLGVELNFDALDVNILFKNPTIWNKFVDLFLKEEATLSKKQEAIAIIKAFKNVPVILGYLRVIILSSSNNESLALMLLGDLPLSAEINGIPQLENKKRGAIRDETILTAAVKKGYLQLIEALVKRSDVEPDTTNRYGYSALYLAVIKPSHHLHTDKDIKGEALIRDYENANCLYGGYVPYYPNHYSEGFSDDFDFSQLNYIPIKKQLLLIKALLYQSVKKISVDIAITKILYILNGIARYGSSLPMFYHCVILELLLSVQSKDIRHYMQSGEYHPTRFGVLIFENWRQLKNELDKHIFQTAAEVHDAPLTQLYKLFQYYLSKPDATGWVPLLFNHDQPAKENIPRIQMWLDRVKKNEFANEEIALSALNQRIHPRRSDIANKEIPILLFYMHYAKEFILNRTRPEAKAEEKYNKSKKKII